MVGKSDPYAVLSYGKQKDKTKVIKNTQEPQWNHKTKFNVPDGDSRTVMVEVRDSDKLEKNKSMGKLELDTSAYTLFNHLFLDKCSGIGGTTEASGPFSEKILEE